MKKIILSATVAAMALTTTISALENTTVNSDIKALQSQVENLQMENEELWTVLDKTETKAFSDKLNLSFDLRGRVDNFSYKMNGIGANIGQPYDATAETPNRREMAFPQEKKWDGHYSVRGLLNLQTKLDNDTSFIGRIRFDHSSQGDQRLCILSPQDVGSELSSSSVTKFTAFDVDRAYVNIPLMKTSDIPLTASLGILPTTGGSSSNIIENQPRKSVFPSLMFDSNMYGGILTANMSKVTGMENTFLRAIYGKAFTLNDDMFYYQCNRANIQDMDVQGIFAETQLPIGYDNTFWVGINQNKNIKATPFLGGDGAENSGSNTKIKSQQPLGDITNIGAGIEVRGIKIPDVPGSFTGFAHFTVSKPDGNGNCVNYTSSADGSCSVGSDANPAPYYASEMARGTLLTDDGHALYVGGQYESDFGTKFGYEFNQGSDYWWSATQGSEDVFNKLATRGNAHEIYIIQPITSNSYVRVGYMQIDEKATGSGWHFGTPIIKDAQQKNMYLLFNAYF